MFFLGRNVNAFKKFAYQVTTAKEVKTEKIT